VRKQGKAHIQSDQWKKGYVSTVSQLASLNRHLINLRIHNMNLIFYPYEIKLKNY